MSEEKVRASRDKGEACPQAGESQANGGNSEVQHE